MEAADLDGDGSQELLITLSVGESGGLVRVWSIDEAFSPLLDREFVVNSFSGVSPLASANLDGEPGDELVVLLESNVFGLRSVENGWEPLTVEGASADALNIQAIDRNGAAGRVILSYVTREAATLRLEGTRLIAEWTGTADASIVGASDLDADGTDELIGSGAFSVLRVEPSGVITLVARSGSPEALYRPFAGDIDGDGVVDLGGLTGLTGVSGPSVGFVWVRGSR